MWALYSNLIFCHPICTGSIDSGSLLVSFYHILPQVGWMSCIIWRFPVSKLWGTGLATRYSPIPKFSGFIVWKFVDENLVVVPSRHVCPRDLGELNADEEMLNHLVWDPDSGCDSWFQADLLPMNSSSIVPGSLSSEFGLVVQTGNQLPLGTHVLFKFTTVQFTKKIISQWEWKSFSLRIVLGHREPYPWACMPFVQGKQ